ncbi:hypothetical protein P7M41_27005, partial [Vibrio parahaemolyticus]|nr:hypothetical protein [Vibrio parahaemolyticus]
TFKEVVTVLKSTEDKCMDKFFQILLRHTVKVSINSPGYNLLISLKSMGLYLGQAFNSFHTKLLLSKDRENTIKLFI